MVKKAVIVVSLVDESEKQSNDKLRREIAAELCRAPSIIPWMKEVEKVDIIEE